MTPQLLETVEGLEEYLAMSALGSRPLHEVLEGFALRCREGGISLARLMIGWRLLDPLFLSQSLFWRVDSGVFVERYRHREVGTSPDYEVSPIKALLNTDQDQIRVKMAGANAPLGYPLLEELAAQGFSDYLILKVAFGKTVQERLPGTGVVISFVSDAEGGFCDDQLAALLRLKYMLGLTMRVAMEEEMRVTLAKTYLARSAAQKVLAGQIQRGEGEAIEAVIWYCDLRGSSALCEAMGADAYLPLLNDYFSATAGLVSHAGGDVLDFIGDAVLAIFPLAESGLSRALSATSAVLSGLGAFAARHPVLADRATHADILGIAMDVGTVTYGNIGTPERLTFSVIGPTVNKVARIERLTKTLRAPVLVTAAVAAGAPADWQGRGLFHLDGVHEAIELYSPQTMPRFLAP